MPEISGTVQRLEPSTTLWLLPLVPLVGFLFFALIGRRQSGPLVHKLGLVFALGTLGIGIWQSATLYDLPEKARFLFWHGWPMARAGSVSLDFALGLDPLSAAVSLVVAALLVVASLRAASAQRLACLHLGAFSALLLALGDGFVPMLFGLQGLGLALFWMSGASLPSLATRGLALHQLAVASLLAGGLLVLWGLGGRWLADGIYQADLQPRYAALPVEDAGIGLPSAGDSALLTFTSSPGALLYLDNAPFAYSPFVREPIEPGRHYVRIEPGPAEPAYEVNWFVTQPGKETSIAYIGPTVSFREIRDQLGFVDDATRTSFGQLFASKKLFGLPLVTLACVLFCIPVVALVAQLAAFARHRRGIAGFPFAVAALAIAAVYLLARLWFFFELTQASTSYLVGLVAVGLLGASTAWRTEGARCSA